MFERVFVFCHLSLAGNDRRAEVYFVCGIETSVILPPPFLIFLSHIIFQIHGHFMFCAFTCAHAHTHTRTHARSLVAQLLKLEEPETCR